MADGKTENAVAFVDTPHRVILAIVTILTMTLHQAGTEPSARPSGNAFSV